MSLRLAVLGFFALYFLSNVQNDDAPPLKYVVRVAECRALNFGRLFHRLPYWIRPPSYCANFLVIAKWK